MEAPLIDFHFDFETRSRMNLKKVGSVRYAADPSTEATLITWGFSRTGSIKAWRIGSPIPNDLKDVLLNPSKYNFIAYNIGFDYLIWILPFTRQVSAYNIFAKRPEVKNITDCMALSQHFRMGGSLAGTANMLDIPTSKDKEGRRIMLKQCKPNSRTGEFPMLTDEEWRDFERYGIIDTVMLREAYYRLPPLPAAERWIFEWTFKRNLTGIKIDTEVVAEMDKIVKHYLPQLEQEFFGITGLKVKSPKCLGFFQPHFPWIQNMQADTVRDMQLRTQGVNPIVVRALELKALAGSTSISKVTAAVNMQLNGRIYDLFSYHMAQTKRFAGRGIQIHNFPRPAKKPKDFIPEDLNIVDLAGFIRNAAPTLQDPIDFVKNLLRRIWVVEEGSTLYCGDFSKVEPTVLRWLTGMGPISPTAYEEMAVHIYNIPLDQIGKDSEERTVGKAANLGGGYGMGFKKFMDDTAKKTGIILEEDFARHVISTYRKVNRPIVEFWRDLQAAFRKAINGEGSALCNRKVFVMPMDSPWKGVQIRLPSGSMLYYHKASVEVAIEETEIVEIINGLPTVRKISRAVENLYYVTEGNGGRPQKTKIYGGLLTEHVTSATARDLLTYSMYNLEQTGFDVLATVHDEAWGKQIPGRELEFQSTMCQLPYWCTDIQLTADLKCGVRYLK